MLPAAKKITLCLWLLLLGVATSWAFVPHALENRTWEKIVPTPEPHLANSLQAAELHQDEKRWRLKLTPDQTYPVNGMDPTGRCSQDNSGGNPGLMIYTNNQDTYNRYTGAQSDYGQLASANVTYVGSSQSPNNAFLATDLPVNVSPTFGGNTYDNRVVINSSEVWYYYGEGDAQNKEEELAFNAISSLTPALTGFSPSAGGSVLGDAGAIQRGSLFPVLNQTAAKADPIVVNNATITQALQGSTMQTAQGAVSMPMIERYVRMLEAGEVPPAIQVDGNVIVNGNHRYIAGRLFGTEPPMEPYTLPQSQVPNIQPIQNITIDPEDWGGH
jgi:hypothetical protein